MQRAIFYGAWAGTLTGGILAVLLILQRSDSVLMWAVSAALLIAGSGCALVVGGNALSKDDLWRD